MVRHEVRSGRCRCSMLLLLIVFVDGREVVRFFGVRADRWPPRARGGRLRRNRLIARTRPLRRNRLIAGITTGWASRRSYERGEQTWEAGWENKGKMGGGLGERGDPRTDGDEIGWEVGRTHKMGRQLGERRDHRNDGDEIGRKAGRTGPNRTAGDEIGRKSGRTRKLGGRWDGFEARPKDGRTLGEKGEN